MATLHSLGEGGIEGDAPLPSGTIVLYHIPKCAGSTLREIFESRIPEHKIYIVGDDIPGDVARLNQIDQSRFRLVFGHICYGSVRVRGTESITVLRHPVQRVYSLYDYIRRSRGHHLYHLVSDMSLTDFLLSGVTCTIDNGMVRQLCGEDRMLRDPYNDMLIPFGGVTSEHLDNAKTNLRTFSLVGLQERFDEFVEDLCGKFGWTVPRYSRKNVSPERPSLSMSDWTLIETMNQFDLELYEWVENYI